MKLVLSEYEPDAIYHCSELLLNERCVISIVHESEKAEWVETLCQDAYNSQRGFEIQRAYKDFRIDHVVDYLAYPLTEYDHILAAYLQLKHMLGGFSELVYPPKYDKICRAIRGDVKLIKYDSYQQITSDLTFKALSRFKTIKDENKFLVR